MPALLRGVARVAVISGTATATSNAVNRRMAQKNVDAYGNAQQQYAAENAAPAPAVAVGAGPSPGNVVAPPAAAPAAGTDLTAELQKLGELKAQGVLTDEEFSAAKAKLLGG
jgi:hypothetical protein